MNDTLYKASLTDLHDVSAFLGDLLYDSVPGGELGAGGVAVVEDGAGADPGEAAAVQLVGGAGGGQQQQEGQAGPDRGRQLHSTG